MQKYLLYDSGCSTCSHLADMVHEAVGDTLALLSLRTPEAKSLLDEALPNGWRYAPYVVTVDGDSVRARTGVTATMQLGLWMGPVKAMRVWNEVNARFTPKRRNFLQAAVASTLAVLIMGRTVGKTIATTNGCGSCSHSSKCRQHIYTGCGCGTCCSSTFAYDHYVYYRYMEQPLYVGQSCYGCNFCYNVSFHTPCGCPRRW